MRTIHPIFTSSYLRRTLRSPDRLDLKPHYNVAPTQSVLAVRVSEEDEKEAVSLRWRLIPPWAKDEKMGYKTFNARGEKVAEKSSFRSAFKRKRCLVVADEFFEWKRDGKEKQPFLIKMKDEKPFAFAGIWEYWDKDGEPMETCAILTTSPNAPCKKIHNRMPVILSPDNYDQWLDPENEDPKTLQKLFKPFPAKGMEAYPVSIHVNSPRSNDEGCVEPLEN